MPAREGWDYAQLKAGFAGDPEFVKLARLLAQDGPEAYLAAVGLWTLCIGYAWRNDRRDVSEILAGEPAHLIAALTNVGLITAGHEIRGFDKWTASVRGEREKRRQRQANWRAGRHAASPVSDGESRAVTRRLRTGKGKGEGEESVVPPGGGPPDARAREAENEPWTDEEGEALSWLARHGVALTPGNGYHRKLVTATAVHGVNAIVGMFDRLAAAGVRNGDTKGFLFGAIDALDARTRPSLSELEAEDRAEERAESHAAQLDKTRRYIAELTREAKP